MITSSIRRAGLLAAVAAALPFSAAAQSDAAFAAALQQGAPTPAQFAQIKKRPQRPEPPAAPAAKALSADATVWAQVLETVKRDGKYTPGNVFMPGSFSIQESSGDPKGEFSKRAISVLGALNEEELFEPMGAMIAVVEAKRDPATGNLILDQWMFQTDVYGEVGEAVHNTTTMSPDGKPLAPTSSKIDLADPKVKAQYDAMLKHWAERKP